jgi:hypothetical protein
MPQGAAASSGATFMLTPLMQADMPTVVCIIHRRVNHEEGVMTESAAHLPTAIRSSSVR